MTKDVLKLALEALEELQPDDAYPYSLQSKAITAIKQALAAPVQEPNSGCGRCENMSKPCDITGSSCAVDHLDTLEAQRQWVGLTDEEIAKLDCYDHLKFARAIEAKLKEKNT